MDSNDNLPADNASAHVQDDSEFYRDLIRLLQCSRCSRLLNPPVRLPCGNVICKSCIPPPHERKNVTYPGTDERKQGFFCPFVDRNNEDLGILKCKSEHAIADCGVDVVLTRVIGVFAKWVATDPITGGPRRLRYAQAGEYHTANTETLASHRGHLVAAYTLAESGLLQFSSGINHHFSGEFQTALAPFDRAILESVKAEVLKELDCQVCYSLMIDPYTTSCGHTFCRQCVTQTLDHSSLCPICRRRLHIASCTDNGNRNLDLLTLKLFPDQYTPPLKTTGQHESGVKMEVPLFVEDMLSFPTVPTYLHIFEMRYRLMIRNAIEKGDRMFGIVASNRKVRVHEKCEKEHVRYGTLVYIDRFERLPNGKSLIRATGKYRFKVLESHIENGYHVGNIERIDDVTLVKEERREADETATRPAHGSEYPLDRVSTRHLFQIGHEFITKCHAQKIAWMSERRLMAYGPPPSDPEVFPYWFANILPIPLEEKYSLLPTISTRQRLKICASWVRRLERRELVINFSGPSPLLTAQFSLFFPLLFLFCISFGPPALGPLFKRFLSYTNITAPAGFSFSALPFGFAFSYSSVQFPPVPPIEAARNQGFVVAPSLKISEFFSKYLILGAIVVICLGRAIRRLSEMVSRHRVMDAAHYAYTSSTNHNATASTSSSSTSTGNETDSTTTTTTPDTTASDGSAAGQAVDEEQRHMETLASGGIHEEPPQSA